MKTVIIPNDYHPFVIEVNGVKYTYPEGTEQSVPDEVASAIEHYYKLQPREGDPNPVPFGVDADGKEEYKSKYTGAEIDAAVAKAGTVPSVTAADAGSALVVDEEGKIVAGAAGGRHVNTLSDAAAASIQSGIQAALPTLISTGTATYSYSLLNTDEISFETVESIETSLEAGTSTEVLSVNGLDLVLNKSFHITADSEIIPILTAVSAIELLANTIYLVVFDIRKHSDTQYTLTFNFQQLSGE